MTGKAEQGDEIIRTDQVKDNESRAVHLSHCCQNTLLNAHVHRHTYIHTCLHTETFGHGISTVK